MRRATGMLRLVALVGLATLGSCVTFDADRDPLAETRVVADFETYRVRRVGLTPFAGRDLSIGDSETIQDAFHTELSRTASFEIVPLNLTDLAEIPDSTPFRSGWVEPRTVIDLARRFRLDAILVGTITERQAFTPQRFGAQLDMIAAETGVPIWSATIHADASDERVRSGIERWFDETRAAHETGETWELVLLSPRRFVQFAAYEVARGL